MPTIINGSTGVSLVQDSTITSAKIVDGSIAVADLSSDSTSIGVGQTWQNVTRTSGTTYYNTTGKPIKVIFSGSSGLTSMNVLVNSVNVATGYVVGAGTAPLIEVVVPSGNSYSCTVGTGSVIATELR
jgi:hypothetical protein